MDVLKELNDKLATAQNKAQELGALSEKEDFDKESFDAAIKECENIKSQIEVAEKVQKVGGYKPAALPAIEPSEPENPHIYTKEGFELEHEDKGTYGFKSGAEMIQKIAYQKLGLEDDPRVQFAEQTSGFATTKTDGVEIPADFLPDVREQAPAIMTEIDRFNPITTSRNRIEYVRNQTTPGQAVGIQVFDVAEGGTINPSRDINNGGGFNLHKKAALSGITSEDLADLPILESRYMRKAPELIMLSWWEDIIAGDGSGKTLGFRNAAATINVTRNTVSTLKYEDIRAVVNRSFAGPGTFWFAGHDTKDNLMGLVNANNQLIWRDNINEGVTGIQIKPFLAGYPIIFSEDAAKLGDLGDLALIDPAGMILGQKGSGTNFASSMHFYFDTDKMALRWTKRVGGEPTFDAAYTPRNGGASLSHVVQVAA